MFKKFKMYGNIHDQTIIKQFTFYTISIILVTRDVIKTDYITKYTILSKKKLNIQLNMQYSL